MIKTEKRNPKTTHIDKMTVSEIVSIMCEENYNAAKAVENASTSIVMAVEAIVNSFKQEGRLFFVGAGTSGRLGILDAAECPPTFGVNQKMVNGIIAGGEKCIVCASEGAEDSAENGIKDIDKNGVRANDVVVGISVAGNAAYVVAALKKAREIGAVTISLCSNEDGKIAHESNISICTDTGAEVVTGSTRLKAGTAHKMVLNILTTCSMIKMGYVYENMMINLKPTNIKLTNRMIYIVSEICGCDNSVSKKLLEESGWNIKTAVEKYNYRKG